MAHEPLAAMPRRLKGLIQHAALETLFVRRLDAEIGVSSTDTTWLRLVASQAVTIRIGLDLERFSAAPVPAQCGSLVFWGRMDFDPNVDAV